MSQQELIEKLYFLRAGMSLIAGCKKTIDDYAKEERRIKEESKKKIQDIQDMISRNQQQLQQQSGTADAAQRRAKAEGQTKRRDIAKAILWSLALLLCLGVAYVLLVTVNYSFFKGAIPVINGKMTTLLITLIIQAIISIVGNLNIAIAIFLVLLVVVCIGAFKLAQHGVRQLKLSIISIRSASRGQVGDRKKAETARGSKKKIMVHLQQMQENAPATIARIQEEEAEQLAQLAKEKGGKRDEAIALAKNTYDVLVEQSVIDMRDWGALDLIIFALETGRADTLKEALLIVDQERRNDALVHAIESATKEVARTIRISTKQVQHTIREATSSLASSVSSSMAAVRQEVQAVGAKVESGMSQMSAQQAQILTAQQAQMALQREANATSEFLAKTVASTVDITGRVQVTM